MDETKIAEQVAKNIKTEQHIPAPEVVEEPQPSAFESNVELSSEMLTAKLADYFDLSRVDRYDESYQRQIKTVHEWAAQRAQSLGTGDALEQIRILELELGVAFKPDRLPRLAKWVRLKQHADSINKEMEYLRG